MITLDQLQRRMCAAIRGSDEPELLGLIEHNRIDAAALLRIYHNHAVLTLTEALKATYPVVCRLVDERFFSYAAHEFIRDTLPSKPCLSEYGESFPDFLTIFPACRHLAYLPDVARLEWAINAAVHATEAQLLDRSALETPDPLLRLHPSLRLVASRWPIDLIWRANQPEASPGTVIDLDAGAARLQVYRRGVCVVICGIDDGKYAFLAAIAGGAQLRLAIEAGARADRKFDAPENLDFLFAEGLIVQPASSTAPCAETSAGEKRRPDIKTNETSRMTSRSVTG